MAETKGRGKRRNTCGQVHSREVAVSAVGSGKASLTRVFWDWSLTSPARSEPTLDVCTIVRCVLLRERATYPHFTVEMTEVQRPRGALCDSHKSFEWKLSLKGRRTRGVPPKVLKRGLQTPHRRPETLRGLAFGLSPRRTPAGTSPPRFRLVSASG